MKHYENRQYQIDAAEALYSSIKQEGIKPVIAVPTGAGKTIILCLLIKQYLIDNPDNEILILTHTKNIIEQDLTALEDFFPEHPIGAYSSGLGRKEKEQITVGGIQSVIKNPDLFRWSNLVIIDEVHKVSHTNEGSYRKLLDGMHAEMCGMSATVFRSGHGYIYKGKGTLFNHLAYDLTSVKNYNKLVKDGYLCKLIAVDTKIKLDSSMVKKSGGDYNIKALAMAHNQESITKAAITEALHYGRKYKKWLVFAIDIAHADNIANQLNSIGIKSKSYHSRSKGDTALEEFTKGDLRALVSVEKITTGFDSPQVDLILMLRPTMSAILHVQMAGRGTRINPGKDHCLFLDYAGNTERLGPINNVIIPQEQKKGKEGGEAPTKTCPKCRTITHAQARTCDSCGHEFIFESKLQLTASTEEIVTTIDHPEIKEKWLNVDRVRYNIHRKPGSPDSLLITYNCGIKVIKEYVCVDHTGFAGRKAAHIVGYRGYQGDLTTYDVYRNRNSLKVPRQILVDMTTKYLNIVNSRF